jgi:hypothetical protein
MKNETISHPLTRSLSERLNSHFVRTAVVAAVACSAASQAAIVSFDVNLTVPATTDGLYLNVLNGASTTGTGTAVPGWDINPYSSTGLAFFSPSNPSGGAYVVSAPSTVHNLPPGTVISGGSTFGSENNISTFAQWTLNSSNNLIGFRFLNETTSQVHYGWFRLQIGATITQRTLTEYAYESVAGESIAAGVKVIPEPGIFGLVGMAALGLGCLRRRG